MKKTTLLAAAFIAVMGTSAHAEINNDLSPGDRIKARWEDQTQESTYGQWRQDQHNWAQMNNSQRQEKLNEADEKYYSKNIGERTSQARADDKMAGGKTYTPEQRAAHRQAMHKKWAAMTPEQKAAAKAAHDKKVANMTPEQKAAHANRKAKMEAMTPEQKAAHKAKWDAMTPAQKAAWKANHPHRGMHHTMTNSMTNTTVTHSTTPATTPATAN